MQNANDLSENGSIQLKSKANVLTSPYMVWLMLMVASFFYVLPLGRFSIGGYSSDFRIYDFVFILFFLFAGRYQLKRFFVLVRYRSQFHRYALILCGLVVISILFTWITRGTSELLPVLIRVYRFIIYFLIGSFTFITISTPARQRFAIQLYYGLIILQTLLAFAQSMKWLPNFWPSYWLVGYGDFPVATLSPHHLQIGIVMMIGIALSMTFIQIYKNLVVRIACSLLLSMMVIVSIRAEIRTVWFALVGWLLIYVLLQRGRAILPFIILLVGVLAVYLLLGSEVIPSLEEAVNRRLVNPYLFEGAYGVLGDRMQVYDFNIIHSLLAQPWVIFFGAGFQNVKYVLRGATGAHNNFLQAFFELGIVGFIIYLLFLRAILLMLWKTIHLSTGKIQVTIAKDVFALFIGILITMFAGETMWAQYSMFTLTGQIMVIVAIAVSPLNWLPNKKPAPVA